MSLSSCCRGPSGTHGRTGYLSGGWRSGSRLAVGHRRPNPVRKQRHILDVTYTAVNLTSKKELASPWVQVMALPKPIQVVNLSRGNKRL